MYHRGLCRVVHSYDEVLRWSCWIHYVVHTYVISLHLCFHVMSVMILYVLDYRGLNFESSSESLNLLSTLADTCSCPSSFQSGMLPTELRRFQRCVCLIFWVNHVIEPPPPPRPGGLCPLLPERKMTFLPSSLKCFPQPPAPCSLQPQKVMLSPQIPENK